jgi:hypothetical protein
MVGGCWLATVQFRVPMSFPVEELRAKVKTQIKLEAGSSAHT